MKNILIKRLLSFFIFLIFISSVHSQEIENKIKDIEILYEKKIISSNEYSKSKKILLDKKKELILQKDIKNKKKILLKKSKSKKNKKLFSKKDEKKIEFKELENLGIYTELKIEDYPEGMYLHLSKGCKSNICISKKATKKMSLIFKHTPKWAERNPGQLIKGMGYFELLYWSNLRKYDKNLQRYKENWPKNYKNKKNDEKKIRTLLSLNKGRKKMREALGMDIKLPIKDAMKKYWVLGSFLDLGEGKNLKKINPELAKRKNLLAEYKKRINNLKKKLNENE